jgi:putative SOS response-associated peptidase YedK
MFSSLVQDRRCLIPASGFFEWKKAGRLKIPYYIHRKDDALFAFAGLYDIWRAGNEPLYSCTIITTEPNRVVAPLHDRMPAILCRDDEDLWLGKGGLDKSCLARVLSPYPEEELEAYQVSRRVNDTSQDSVEIITPWKGESLILEEGV